MYAFGGVDSFNMLVPHSNCGDHDLYAEYASLRTSSHALTQDELLQISVPTGTQPCDTFGVNPGLSYVKGLYDAGEASFIANIGSLLHSMTVDEYETEAKEAPPGIFSHSQMRDNGMTNDPKFSSAKGVLGRILDAVTSQADPYKTAAYSTDGTAKIIESNNVPLDQIHKNMGVVTWEQQSELFDTLDSMITDKASSSIYADSWSGPLSEALSRTESLSTTLSSASLTQSYSSSNRLDMQFKQAAKVVQQRSSLDFERAAFYTHVQVPDCGGWDHHFTGKSGLETCLSQLDDAISHFVEELKADGMWESTTMVFFSEFARTLAPNGAGTDHAWGGHTFVLSGDLDGGSVFGSYPSTLSDETSSESLGRNRYVPTTPWEGMWKPIAEWFGVDASMMTSVLPNVNNFDTSTIITKEAMYGT